MGRVPVIGLRVLADGVIAQIVVAVGIGGLGVIVWRVVGVNAAISVAICASEVAPQQVIGACCLSGGVGMPVVAHVGARDAVPGPILSRAQRRHVEQIRPAP